VIVKHLRNINLFTTDRSTAQSFEVDTAQLSTGSGSGFDGNGTHRRAGAPLSCSASAVSRAILANAAE